MSGQAAAAAATVAGLAWLGSDSQHPPSYSPHPPPRRPFYYLRFVRPGRTHPRTEFGRRLQAEMIEPDEFLSEMTVRPVQATRPVSPAELTAMIPNRYDPPTRLEAR